MATTLARFKSPESKNLDANICHLFAFSLGAEDGDRQQQPVL